MGGLVAVMIVVALTAPDTARPDAEVLHQELAERGSIIPSVRAIALAIVGVSWALALFTLGRFMVSMLTTPAGAKQPSVADFTKEFGPWIIFGTVFVPLIVAAALNWMRSRGRYVLEGHAGHAGGSAIVNHLYVSLVAPLGELSARLRWGVLIVIGLILTYTLCYNIWTAFAFPFYLDYLHYSKDEVAFASKLFGIIMTMIGISIGGYLFLKIGRLPTILIGAVLPVFGNFVYADLAEGGHNIGAFSRLFRFDYLASLFGSDERMVRLLVAISMENISTGIAGAAFVAYISGIVSRRFTAVQYALLSSLTFLIGSLGRGIAGEGFDKYGYATVFRWTAAAGAFAVLFVILEWMRVAADGRRAELGTAPKVEAAKT